MDMGTNSLNDPSIIANPKAIDEWLIAAGGVMQPSAKIEAK
jgi:hypothetical protein